MTIPLPNLDTKSYEELVDEMISSIPNYTDTWTNHNPSDPGITILELLSWIAETTLYRINRIPDGSYVNFLRFVAGASGIDDVKRALNDPYLDRSHRQILEFLREIEEGDKKTIAEMKTNALRFMRSRYRAITESDFQRLAMEATSDRGEGQAKVRRAIVYRSPDKDKVEIVIVSDDRDHYEELIFFVKDYLRPRTLIGTKIEVRQPVYTDVAIDIKAVCHHYAVPKKVEDNIRKRIMRHLDPFAGGDEKTGWAYRRPLTVYEIAQIVEETAGIKQSMSITFDGEKIMIKDIGGLINVSSVNVEVMKEDK
jgi:predicted RNA-binding protein with TRAM domain